MIKGPLLYAEFGKGLEELAEAARKHPEGEWPQMGENRSFFTFFFLAVKVGISNMVKELEEDPIGEWLIFFLSGPFICIPLSFAAMTSQMERLIKMAEHDPKGESEKKRPRTLDSNKDIVRVHVSAGSGEMG